MYTLLIFHTLFVGGEILSPNTFDEILVEDEPIFRTSTVSTTLLNSNEFCAFKEKLTQIIIDDINIFFIL